MHSNGQKTRPPSFWKNTPIICLYIIYLLIATLYPFEFSAESSNSVRGFLATFLDPLPEGAHQLFSGDFVRNFIFLIPCGFLFHHLLVEQRKEWSFSTLLLAGASGAALSFLIELTQVFIPGRSASAKDVLSNSGGALCGALVFALCPVRIDNVVWKVATSKKALAIVCLLGAWPTMMWMARYPWFHFNNWNPRFALQLGNDDPAWTGKIYWAAIYNRALSENEVRNHFEVGYSDLKLPRNFLPKPITLYTFNEGQGTTIRDSAQYEQPLDLAPNGSGFRWLNGSNGIEFVGPAVLRSAGSSTRLVDALQATNELSIELWISPAEETENEPASILSFSKGSRANFAIDQIDRAVSFRLRTPITGTHGTNVNLRMHGNTLSSDIVHLVATYRKGVERLFVNGLPYPEVLDLTSSTVVGLLARNLPGPQLAYAFCYFFPVAFFVATGVTAKRRSSFWGLVFGMAFSGSTFMTPELLRFAFLGRYPDLSLMVLGLIVEALGVVCGVVYAVNLNVA